MAKVADGDEFVPGRVLTVSKPEVNENLAKSTGIVATRQNLEVEILDGEHKGERVTVNNEITDNPVFNINVKPGLEVVIALSHDGESGKLEYNIADYHRAPTVSILLIVFLAAFLIFGGKKGLKSLIALIISVLLIAYVLLPLSLAGFDPLLVSVFICLATTCTTMYFVGGWSKKSLAAMIGTTCGVICAGLAAHLAISFAPLTGLSSDEAQLLRGSVLVKSESFYQGLLAAGMLIGALGVIMDVGVSIASAVAEVARIGEEQSQLGDKLDAKKLYEAGMNVGRDIMGTMTNTLILAYTGSALPLLLLVSQIPAGKLVNLDLVATEVVSAISGSLGLVLTIPMTALAAARLMSTAVEKKEK